MPSADDPLGRNASLAPLKWERFSVSVFDFLDSSKNQTLDKLKPILRLADMFLGDYELVSLMSQ
jgi:hypothetical protein